MIYNEKNPDPRLAEATRTAASCLLASGSQWSTLRWGHATSCAASKTTRCLVPGRMHDVEVRWIDAKVVHGCSNLSQRYELLIMHLSIQLRYLTLGFGVTGQLL